jgi:hypothetical protein
MRSRSGSLARDDVNDNGLPFPPRTSPFSTAIVSE